MRDDEADQVLYTVEPGWFWTTGPRAVRARLQAREWHRRRVRRLAYAIANEGEGDAELRQLGAAMSADLRELGYQPDEYADVDVVERFLIGIFFSSRFTA